jgi:hypothetical protein
LAEVRLYEAPNLMMVASPSIVTAPTESVAGHVATNLIQGLNRRQASSEFGPLTAVGSADGLVKTCFTTDKAQLAGTYNKYVLGVGFNRSVFMNAVLVVQDIVAWNSPEVNYNRFKNFDIYIGEDSLDYSANAKCAGGKLNSPSSSLSFDNESNWNYG